MQNHTRGRYATPRKSNPFYLLAALAAIGMLLLVGACSSAEADDTPRSAGTPQQTTLEAAHDDCGVSATYIRIGDGGHTLLIDHQGEHDSTGASLDDVACVLIELDIPDSVVAQIDATRAMDGRQTASWGEFEVLWSYHPDSGIDMIVTEG